MFPLLIAIATLIVWLPRQDKGPPLTDYGKEQARLDSLALHPDTTRYVRPDSL